MILLRHEIIVIGTPVPKGSLRCVGRRGRRAHVLIEDNPHTSSWRAQIAAYAAQHIDEQADKGQAIGVEITSTLRRPSSHYGTGRNTGVLKTRALAHPTQLRTGDVDKLARLVLDALQDAGVLNDDAQVVEVISRKRWPVPGSDATGVRIQVYPIDGHE